MAGSSMKTRGAAELDALRRSRRVRLAPATGAKNSHPGKIVASPVLVLT
jgi:hypothetical protein